jgi:outer membrane protein insertion porin family
LCRALGADTSQHALDYRLAADFTQPYFLSPRNQLTTSLFAERVSEPNVYQRRAEGGQLTINHRLEPRRLLTASVEISRARTVASPVLFCSAFQICIPEARDSLTVPRFRNTLGLNYLDEHTDNQLDPTAGHLLRTGFAWAAPWLSSSVRFLRWTGETAWYHTVSPGHVFAVSFRLGNFFRTASIDPTGTVNNFLPPEERFYAGGANSVRGFARNGLGPGAYVTDSITVNATGDTVPARDPTFVPTGGTALGIFNAELRLPSPLFRRQMRLGVFIDGGALTNQNIWQMDLGDWRFTPGVGARIITPVGPARVDVAYNAYRPVTGVLFFAESSRIVPIRDDYTPTKSGFFGRMRVQVAIGQAF